MRAAVKKMPPIELRVGEKRVSAPGGQWYQGVNNGVQERLQGGCGAQEERNVQKSPWSCSWSSEHIGSLRTGCTTGAAAKDRGSEHRTGWGS